jgi:ATP-binding cassette, subfamily B, bacterial
VMRGRTTLVIAHRPATIALADRVAVLEAGRIVEEGTHEELLRGSARYRALLALEEAAA